MQLSNLPTWKLEMSEGLKRIIDVPSSTKPERAFTTLSRGSASVDRVVCRILSDRLTDERVFTEEDPFERSQLARERWSIGIRLFSVDDLIKLIRLKVVQCFFLTNQPRRI